MEVYAQQLADRDKWREGLPQARGAENDRLGKLLVLKGFVGGYIVFGGIFFCFFALLKGLLEKCFLIFLGFLIIPYPSIETPLWKRKNEDPKQANSPLSEGRSF